MESDANNLLEYRVEQLEESVNLLAHALNDIVREFSRAKWVIGTLLATNITLDSNITSIIRGLIGNG